MANPTEFEAHLSERGYQYRLQGGGTALSYIITTDINTEKGKYHISFDEQMVWEWPLEMLKHRIDQLVLEVKKENAKELRKWLPPITYEHVSKIDRGPDSHPNLWMLVKKVLMNVEGMHLADVLDAILDQVRKVRGQYIEFGVIDRELFVHFIMDEQLAYQLVRATRSEPVKPIDIGNRQIYYNREVPGYLEETVKGFRLFGRPVVLVPFIETGHNVVIEFTLEGEG